MDKKNQNKESLATPEKMYNEDADKQNPCEELLNRMRGQALPVSLQASAGPVDCNNPQFREIAGIYDFIRSSRIDFNCYKRAMDNILNNIPKSNKTKTTRKNLKDMCEDDILDNDDIDPKTTEIFKEIADNTNQFSNTPLYRNSKAYSILKYATELYVYSHFGYDNDEVPRSPEVLPYIALVEASIGEISCKYQAGSFQPLFAELIWNYWMEEGMMGKTINAVVNRFQNKRSSAGLNNLVLDPLRPLSNLIWGYIQDSTNHLALARILGEFAQQYGLPVFAAGGLNMPAAETRSAFVLAFNNLLSKCSLFYQEADNLMKVPDAFPLLNALREVHMVLSEGANNQFGDLPVTARAETLLQQYILSRPEMREFLGGRVMVPYDEAWMDRVDSMKALQGWPGASVSYFRDLAVYGEQILLSIRWISWSQFKNRDFAREWAMLFREDIQRYIHCYQAVTGVDLAATTFAGAPDLKAIPPALLMKRKAQIEIASGRR